MTSYLWNKESILVKSNTLEEIYCTMDMTECNFIKMDIEGGEYLALPAGKDILNKYKPTLYLSLHTPYFNESDPNNDYMEKICDVLSIYKKVYNMKGEEISLDEVAVLKWFTSIVATFSESTIYD